MKIIEHDSVDSTMLEARRSLKRGHFPECIWAKEQTEGRGRLERYWRSVAGAGLWLTFGLKLPADAQRWPSLSLVSGLSLIKVLQEYGAALPIGLKWPNDLMTQDASAKIGGTLVEVESVEDTSIALVGIGLNLSSAEKLPPTADAPIAEGLERWWKPLDTHSQRKLVSAIGQQLQLDHQHWFEEGFDGAFERRWRRWDILEGQPVRVDSHSGALQGIARGILSTGALRVEVKGQEHLVLAGDVERIRRL